ncbi:MAG: exodeoxyribonuclease V subunit alpha [Deltaproteobacteria bacterium]|nr:exodeoxyribonuclease V subunit alpha [Deltaproteobacteria bacterium]
MISLHRLFEAKRIAMLDLHFARLIERLAREANASHPEILGLTAALVSRERRKGHSCVNLREVFDPFALDDDAAEQIDPAFDMDLLFGGEIASPPKPLPDNTEVNLFPSLDSWRRLLRSAETLVSDGSVVRPLVLDAKDRLYLFRYFQAEKHIADTIASMVERKDELSIAFDVSELRRSFPPQRDGDINWQAVAAANALRRRLSIIVGGPGTGKTASVVAILALLLKASPALRVAMAAPTGKAAARLSEAIRERLRAPESLDVDKSLMPTEVRTVHRLLGYRGTDHGFRYHARERMPFDVVIVDEASMVDLLLFDALFSALPDDARLILIGDKNQLPSVDTGYVLWDICEAARLSEPYSEDFLADFREILRIEPSDLPPEAVPRQAGASPSLRDSIVELVSNYRFAVGSPIGDLARAIQQADPDRALALLYDGGRPSVRLVEGQTVIDGIANTDNAARGDHLLEQSEQQSATSVSRILGLYLRIVELAKTVSNEKRATERAVAQAFELLRRGRILCATNHGKYGLAQTTRRVEDQLGGSERIAISGAFYPGRPVMLTTNDYQLNLFNGDVGVCWPDEKGELAVFFEATKPDGSGYFRRLPVSRLPEHQTAWAMTVHKSQGSQFEHVVLLLLEKPNKILTRELIYTGVTRASKSILIGAHPDTLRAAINCPTRRDSGLTEILSQRLVRLSSR